MRKSLTAAMTALTFGGAIAATATPAQAQRGYYNGGYYGHHHSNDAGVAVAAGVVGLALGAAIASNNRPYAYNNGYYAHSYGNSPYYGDQYYYAQPRYVYRTCESARWVWDPYIQDQVLVRSRYRC